jgi:hypothetical protein
MKEINTSNLVAKTLERQRVCDKETEMVCLMKL